MAKLISFAVDQDIPQIDVDILYKHCRRSTLASLDWFGRQILYIAKFTFEGNCYVISLECSNTDVA